MNTMTVSLDLAKYDLATPRAFELEPGDVIGVSGGWFTVATFPVPDQPVNPSFVDVEIAPLGDPAHTRTWQILYGARMAVLRAGEVR